jgi:hypothetical protein
MFLRLAARMRCARHFIMATGVIKTSSTPQLKPFTISQLIQTSLDSLPSK